MTFKLYRDLLSLHLNKSNYWPIKLTSELFGPIGSSWVHSVLFGPLQSYSVHIGLIWSILSSSIHFGSIRYCSVYSVYFGPIRSTSVHYVLFGFHKACVIEALTIGLPNNSHGNYPFYNVFGVPDHTTCLSVTAIEWKWQQWRRRSWCHRRHGGAKRKPQKSSETMTIDDSLVEVTTS